MASGRCYQFCYSRVFKIRQKWCKKTVHYHLTPPPPPQPTNKTSQKPKLFQLPPEQVIDSLRNETGTLLGRVSVVDDVAVISDGGVEN